MKNEGGREAGKCSKVVPDRGDRCLFIFLWSCRLFCNVFPFPVCKAQFIGDWYENRRGARNAIIVLIIRQYYWRTDSPCANRNGGPNPKKIFLAHCAWSALPIGGGVHRCANILAHRTQKIYGNVRILSRQDEATNGSFGALIMPYETNKKKRTKQFGALRLFSSQSPINLALQTENGNTLKNRRRSHKKLNRHRSPRSETIF